MRIEKEQTTVRLSAEFLELLRQEAYEMGVSLNDRIVWLIHKGHDN